MPSDCELLIPQHTQCQLFHSYLFYSYLNIPNVIPALLIPQHTQCKLPWVHEGTPKASLTQWCKTDSHCEILFSPSTFKLGSWLVPKSASHFICCELMSCPTCLNRHNHLYIYHSQRNNNNQQLKHFDWALLAAHGLRGLVKYFHHRDCSLKYGGCGPLENDEVDVQRNCSLQ